MEQHGTLPAYDDHIGLWNNRLRDAIPERIFDGHVHLARLSDLTRPVSPERRKSPLLTFTSLPREKWRAYCESLFSGKDLAGAFVFPLPVREADYRGANRYILETIRADARLKGFLWTHQYRPGDVRLLYDESVRAGTPFFGIKPYFDVTGKNNFDCELSDTLPAWLADFAHREGLAILLHTTGRGVVCPKLREDLARLCDARPGLRLVLAHMGRHICFDDFAAFMESELPFRPEIWMETSSSTLPEIYELYLSHESLRKRLIFGSDLPFGLITGVEEWSETGGALFRTRDRYPWSEPRLCGHGGITYNAYHTIDAILQGVARLRFAAAEEKKLLRDIFLDNALRFIQEKEASS